MKTKFISIISFIFFFAMEATAQKSAGIEHYYFTGLPASSAVVPAAFYHTRNDFHFSTRYNYEDYQTFSLHAGKEFKLNGWFELSILPSLGLLAGKTNGGVMTLASEITRGRLTLSNEPQYCFVSGAEENFIYNWSDLTISFKRFYCGFSVQQTKLKGERFLHEPGIITGLNLGKIEIPVYFFRNQAGDHSFVLGMNWHWEQ